MAEAHAFDLNIERVLEHWPVAFALREFIANALDEQIITGTRSPTVSLDEEGRWHIRDFGRGLSYEHLTQKEDPEKTSHPSVIGQFGIGLKDALAVCDRRKVGVLLRSRHGDITIASHPKAGFADIVTLHGIVAPPSDSALVGTDVVLTGVHKSDVEQAQGYFLHYSGDRLLENTGAGSVLARASMVGPGRIYVKGLLAAEEPTFLFSYNITQLNAPLRRALNRERTNVGRTAYSDRVKDILKACTSSLVVGPLTEDLGAVVTGNAHDEINWKDVAIHACRLLQSQEKVVFVTAWQTGLDTVTYARRDGYRPVVVPDDIAQALGRQTDLAGQPIVDLGTYRQEWNDSFEFTFVKPAGLTNRELAIYGLTDTVIRLARVDRSRHGIGEILISETMRLNEAGSGQVLGIWEPAEHRVIIRRDQLRSAASYCGVLLHELSHAVSGASDNTMEFEDALTELVGVVVSEALAQLQTFGHGGSSGPLGVVHSDLVGDG